MYKLNRRFMKPNGMNYYSASILLIMNVYKSNVCIPNGINYFIKTIDVSIHV